nr:SHOCT domain-containing protein [Tissierella creatinophila]
MKGMINMMGYGYGMMGVFGMIIPLLLIGLVIYAIVKLSQNGGVNYNSHKGGSDALDILNQRFANGEISEEEYTTKKEMLRD